MRLCDVMEYLRKVQRRAGNQTVLLGIHFKLSQDTVSYNFNLDLSDCDLTDIPFKFGEINGILDLEHATIKDLSFLPKKAKEIYIGNLSGILRNSDFIPFLFVDSIITFDNSVEFIKILNNGRINGKMPRELIPGKINELRDLDANH